MYSAPFIKLVEGNLMTSNETTTQSKDFKNYRHPRFNPKKDGSLKKVIQIVKDGVPTYGDFNPHEQKKDKTPNRRGHLLSRGESRKLKRSIRALSDSQKKGEGAFEQTRTIVCKTKGDVRPEANFELMRETYNTLNALDFGSLKFSFLALPFLGMIASPKTAQCVINENREHFVPDGLFESIVKDLGVLGEGMTPETIALAVQAEPGKKCCPDKGRVEFKKVLFRAFPKSMGFSLEYVINQIKGLTAELPKLESEVAALKSEVAQIEKDLQELSEESKKYQRTEKSLLKKESDLKTKELKLAEYEQKLTNYKAERDSFFKVDDFIQEVLDNVVACSEVKDRADFLNLDKKVYVYECFDLALKKLNPEYSGRLTSLASFFKNHKPKGRTIAFVPDLEYKGMDFLKDNADILPYLNFSALMNRLVSLGLLKRGEFSPKVITTFNDLVLSPNNDALNSFLGVGFEKIRTSSLEELRDYFNVESDKDDTIKALQELLTLAVEDHVFGKKSYSEFRVEVGSQIKSFYSNHGARCIAFYNASIDPSPIEVSGDLWNLSNAYLFRKTYANPEFLKNQIESVNSSGEVLKSRLFRIMGYSEELPSREDIEFFKDFSRLVDRTFSDIERINTSLKEEIKTYDPKTDKKIIKSLEDLIIITPKWAKDIKKLAGVGGGKKSAKEEAQDLIDRFNLIRSRLNTQVDAVVVTAGNLETMEVHKQVSLDALKSNLDYDSTVDYDELYYRETFDSLIRLIRDTNCPPLIKKFRDDVVSYGLVRGSGIKPLTVYINSGKGRVFVHPKSNYKHSALNIELSILEKFNPVAYLEGLLEYLDSIPRLKPGRLFCLKETIRLEIIKFKIFNIPDTVPVSSINQDYFDLIEGRTFLSDITRDKDEILNSEFRTIINCYITTLRSIIPDVTQEGVSLRLTFRKKGTSTVMGVPKHEEVTTNEKGETESIFKFTLPASLEYSKGPLSTLISELKNPSSVFKVESKVTKESFPKIEVSVGKGHQVVKLSERSIKKLTSPELVASDGKKIPNPYLEGVSQLLNYIPQNLCIETGWKVSKSDKDTRGITFGKKKLGFKSAPGVLKLVSGATQLQTVQQSLIDEDINLGDVEYVFEQKYKKKLDFRGDQVFLRNVKIEHSKNKPEVEVFLNIPVTEKRLIKKSAISPFNHTADIGFDLGEYGLAYAVLDIRTGEIKATGFVPIKMFRKLINVVNSYRKHNQPRRDYSKFSDSKLQNMKEAATAEICTIIWSLMDLHNALPVFENNVSGLSRGKNAVRNIYANVVDYFVRNSSNAASQSRLKHSFYGDIKITRTDGKGKKIFYSPGRVVSGAYTSQECSCCGKNPVRMVRYSDVEEYSIDSEGAVILDGEFKYYLKATAKNNTSKHTRADFTAAFKPGGKIRKKDLISRIKLQMRRAPVDKRTKNSSQSRYVCLFDDCSLVEMSADTNAAINIVKR